MQQNDAVKIFKKDGKDGLETEVDYEKNGEEYIFILEHSKHCWQWDVVVTFDSN